MTSPLYLSQRTADRVGLTPRQFRETVLKYGIRCTRLGRLVLVRLEDWQMTMDRLAGSGQSAANDDSAPILTCDDFLALAGKRRGGGR